MRKITMLELTASVCDAIDLVDNAIRDHHNRTACGSYHLAKAMGYEGTMLRNIVIAAAMHDLGGLTVETRLKAVTCGFEDVHDHAEKGYRLLAGFAPFLPVAEIIRYHHTPWHNGQAVTEEGEPVALTSQIVMLADRLAVAIASGTNVLAHSESITKKTVARVGYIYQPDLIEAFKELSLKESFWLDIVSTNFRSHFLTLLADTDIVFENGEFEQALRMLSNIIDFRSSFTASHSNGVAVVAEALAELMDWSAEDCADIRDAGYLHDIGKLAVPTEIIEKPDKLSDEERRIIDSHSYFTKRVLSHFAWLGRIMAWAANHHENPNGFGYPSRLKDADLDLGSRILKVADVYMALMEDRPYRASIGTKKTLDILYEMVGRNQVDRQVVDVLAARVDEVEARRNANHVRTCNLYAGFMEGLE